MGFLISIIGLIKRTANATAEILANLSYFILMPVVIMWVINEFYYIGYNIGLYGLVVVSLIVIEMIKGR